MRVRFEPKSNVHREIRTKISKSQKKTAKSLPKLKSVAAVGKLMLCTEMKTN